jgi:hypothetical protein
MYTKMFTTPELVAGAIALVAKTREFQSDARVPVILLSSPWGMKIYRSQAQNQPKALDFTAVYSRLTKITNS